MAEEADSGQERTEEASAKRLFEARERGEIPRSRELTTMLVLLASAGVLWATADSTLTSLRTLMRADFQVERAVRMDSLDLLNVMNEALYVLLVAVAPILAVTAVVSILGSLALGGLNFSPESIGFKWQRVDPLAGMKRIFSAHTAVELGKSTLKFVLLMGIGLLVLRHDAAALANLSNMALEPALRATAVLCFKAFLWVSAGTLLIALIDVPFQRWSYLRRLRMTRQELRDESKETDGSPEVKARIRSLQQELARRRMMEEVPKADVVVTNPEHYACALKFDPATMSAPRLLAKGTDLVALRIREAAKAAGVTVLEAPPLARAVYHTTKLNQEIPAGLYVAVAQVLAYVFQLRARRTGMPQPNAPRDLPIPPELQY